VKPILTEIFFGDRPFSLIVRRIFMSLILAVLATLVYWPGINGPFLFDDIENIINNDYLRPKAIDYNSLFNAAFSSEAGSLGRPIPVLSFALNFYFDNGTATTFPFKLTNVLIHCANGLLIFSFFNLALRRLAESDSKFSSLTSGHALILSFAAALLWVSHPIHLTSVLYVVQRMASLSATFVLLALLSYLKGRTAALSGRKTAGIIYGIGGTTIFGLMGLYSKENAALLPLYILLIESALFSREYPWKTWTALNTRTRTSILAGIVLFCVFVTAYLIDFSLPGYSGRNFTFFERILTEPRILLFYLSLIFLPRVDAFGIFHDDIPISTSFLSPWTTLPALVIIGLLIISSVLLFHRHRLISFSILWFFISHSLESTIIALELVHEHRNYLAAIGPIVIIVYLTYQATVLTGRSRLWWIPGLFLVLFVTNTSLRAWNWSDSASLYDFEARNHPDSARAQASMGSLLAKVGKLEEAKKYFLHAASLRTYEATDLINVQIIHAWQNIEPSEELKQETLKRVRFGLLTPLTGQVLQYAVGCAPRDCALLQDDLLIWLPIYVTRARNQPKKFAHYQFLNAQVLLLAGRRQDAISSLDSAISVCGELLHPYFLLAGIYLQSGDLDMASKILGKLEQANINNPHPRDRAIRRLSDKIQELKFLKARRDG
jgi:tetratricopeptide (TPR) repeat protein